MKEKTKKVYQKPEITRVRLVPEEAALGGCKTVDQAGENGTTCIDVGEGDCFATIYS